MLAITIPSDTHPFALAQDSSAEQKTQQKTTVLELSYPDIDAVVSVSRAKSMPPKAAELPSSALNATAAEQLR